MLLSKIRPYILAAALLPIPAISMAQDSEAAYMRLDLASDLRNETQKMARLACYIGADFHPAQHRAMLQETMAQFEATQRAIENGDSTLGLAAETDERILAALDALNSGWPVLSARLTVVMNGAQLEAPGIAALDMESLSLLEKADDLSNRIASVNGEVLDNLPLIMTLSIDMAGRQIMRTQKAAKEACLIGSGVETVRNQQALEATVTVFSATMEALIEGYPGLIVKAPSLEIKTLLEEAREIWAAPKAALVTLYSTGEIDDTGRMTIGTGLEQVAAKLHDVAELYQEIELNE